MSSDSDKPPHYSRELDWACALLLFAVAAALLAPGSTFSRPTFAALAEWAPEGTWGMALLGIATVRMLALYANGRVRPSPTLRFITATAGACTFAVLSYLFAQDGYEGVGTGVLLYGTLAALDVFSAVRSLNDQARRDDWDRRQVRKKAAMAAAATTEEVDA